LATLSACGPTKRQETILLNASVGVQRAIGRLRRPPSTRVSSATTIAVGLADALNLQRRFRAVAAASRLAPFRDRSARGISAAYPTRQARHSLMSRVGHDRTVALVAAGIVLGASIVSVSAARPLPATGGPTGPGTEVRIAVGGAADIGGTIAEAEPFTDLTPEDFSTKRAGSIDEAASPEELQSAMEAQAELDSLAASTGASIAPVAVAGAAVEGPFLDDGTLLKPVAVDTTVADGSELMETYKVKSGDTLTGIADKFGVSMMTLWWANNLKSKDDLHLGQTLTIPPVTGLVLTVTASDTLAGLAAKYDVKEQEILEANKLEDPNLVVGQVLAIPGAMGKAIPTPKPERDRTSGGGGGGSSGGGGGSSRAPVTYNGGAFRWPVAGGGNYISQYYRYGHYGLDIAADYGSSVRAAAGGTVIFAGWKGNGGGYQVWVAHGSGLYSTYNHMSAISVGSGQRLSKGQQVGRIGQSGRATGPHLHFEVWRGTIWNGGSRVNPLAYL
jgi:murein DD-endopeptidase MepM/ murein hydrolase activator NlpD